MKPFDAQGSFHPKVGEEQISGLAIRGAGAMMLSGGVGSAVQLVATMILARLLKPGDFGLVAMVTVFSLLLVNFGVNGFTEAVIQRDKINEFLVSNLFWINLGAGLFLATSFAAAGSLLARFYHDPRVAHVAVGISATIFITSTSVLHLALLNRAMRFRSVSANDVLSRIASAVVSILLAWRGWGYWALVIGTIAQPLSQSIGAWFLCPWIPRLPRKEPGTGSMVRFGMQVYGSFGVNYFARNMDNLLVGWRFSAQALGFYKKAYDLFALSVGQLVAPLSHVAVSALSRFDRDPVRIKRILGNVLGMAAFVGMGLAADLTLVGKDLIRLMLGPGWAPAGRIFTFFSPGIGVMFVYSTYGWIHQSIGRADRLLRWVIVEFCFTGLLFLLALPWGPVGMATAWTTSFWILTIPGLWYAGRPIGFGIAPVVSAVWKYVVASLLAGSLSFVIIRNFQASFAGLDAVWALARLVATSSLFVVLYLAAVILLHQGCAPIYQLIGLLRQMTVLRRVPAPPVIIQSGEVTP